MQAEAYRANGWDPIHGLGLLPVHERGDITHGAELAVQQRHVVAWPETADIAGEAILARGLEPAVP